MDLFAQPLEISAPGPIDRWDGVLLADATFQGEPEWTSTDAWVADDSPGLAYGVPPTPAVRIGVQAGEDEFVTVVLRSTPPDLGKLVYDSLINVDDHGWDLTAGSVRLVLPAKRGTYRIGIWVDGDTRETTRKVAIVLGEKCPYRLGAPTEATDRARFLAVEELAEAALRQRLEVGAVAGELMLAVYDWARLTRVLRLFIDARAGVEGTIVDWIDPGVIEQQAAAGGRVVAATQRLALLCADERVNHELGEALVSLGAMITSLGDPRAKPDVGGLDGTPGEVERAFGRIVGRWLPAG